MVLNLTLSPETEQKLRELAHASDLTVEDVVRAAIEKLDAPKPAETAPPLTPQERAKAWEEWTSKFPRRDGVHLDDSRESIYAGRGE